jgi:hypothetical protein
VTGQVSTRQAVIQRDLIYAVIRVSVVCVVLVVALLFTQYGATLHGYMQTADFMFSLRHVVIPGHPVVNRRTTAGGCCSLAFALGFLILLSYLVVQFTVLNAAATESINPGEVNLGSGVWINASVWFVGYHGPGCAALSASLAGARLPASRSGALSVQATGFSGTLDTRVSWLNDTRACVVQWSCGLFESDCTVSANGASLIVNLTEPAAGAAAIFAQVQSLPVMSPYQRNAVEMVAVAATGTALRGIKPSYAALAVYQVEFIDFDAAPRTGYKVMSASVESGDMVTSATYLSTPATVSIKIDFRLFLGFVASTVYRPVHWSDFLTQVVSLSSGMLTGLGLLLVAWELATMRFLQSKWAPLRRLRQHTGIGMLAFGMTERDHDLGPRSMSTIELSPIGSLKGRSASTLSDALLPMQVDETPSEMDYDKVCFFIGRTEKLTEG